MGKPPLSVELVQRCLHYEPDTGVLTWKPGNKKSGRAGNVSEKGYRQVMFDGFKYQASHVAWAHFYGRIPVLLDHINGVRDDNRISNLREASYSQNNCNRIIRPSATGFRGVRRERTGRFAARAYLCGREYFAGVFDDPISAALAYDRMATYFYGEFAMTNFRLGLYE
jgi:hypothetical protein